MGGEAILYLGISDVNLSQGAVFYQSRPESCSPQDLLALEEVN